MKPVFHAPTAARLEDITPMGDFVLVRRLPANDRSGLLWLPPGTARKEGLKRGQVMRVGPGDALQQVRCDRCEALAYRLVRPVLSHDAAKPLNYRCDGPCRVAGCGGTVHVTGERSLRAPMHVRPGDIVLYDRAPALTITIEDEEYQMLHEEQHIVAVLEEAEAQEQPAQAA